MPCRNVCYVIWIVIKRRWKLVNDDMETATGEFFSEEQNFQFSDNLIFTRKLLIEASGEWFWLCNISSSKLRLDGFVAKNCYKKITKLRIIVILWSWCRWNRKKGHVNTVMGSKLVDLRLDGFRGYKIQIAKKYMLQNKFACAISRYKQSNGFILIVIKFRVPICVMAILQNRVMSLGEKNIDKKFSLTINVVNVISVRTLMT